MVPPASAVATVTLPIKVVPGARQDALVGWTGDALKMRVIAPAERGKANAAVLKLIAAALQVPRQHVRLVAGATAPRKLLQVDGLTDLELRARLRRHLEK